MNRFLLALILAPPLLGQIPASMQLHEPTRCVFQEGDDPRWAEPGYDDTTWHTRAGSDRNPYLWERCHFAPVPDAVPGDFDLQFRTLAAWILYIDGKASATSGNPQSGWYNLRNLYQAPMPDAAINGRELVIAIRMTRRYAWDNRFAWDAQQLSPALGSHARLELRGVQFALGSFGGGGIVTAISLYAGIVLLILYAADRERRDTLYLGLLAVGIAFTATGAGLPGQLAPVPYIFDPLLYYWGRALFLLIPFFICALRGKTMPRFARIAAFLLLLHHLSRPILQLFPAAIAFPLNQWANSLGPLLVIQCLTLVSLIPLVTAFLPMRAFRRRDFPVFFAAILMALPVVMVLIAQMPGLGFLLLPAVIAGSLINMVVFFYFFVILAFRFRRVHEERAELQADMRAARDVQRR